LVTGTEHHLSHYLSRPAAVKGKGLRRRCAALMPLPPGLSRGG